MGRRNPSLPRTLPELRLIVYNHYIADLDASKPAGQDAALTKTCRLIRQETAQLFLMRLKDLSDQYEQEWQTTKANCRARPTMMGCQRCQPSVALGKKFRNMFEEKKIMLQQDELPVEEGLEV